MRLVSYESQGARGVAVLDGGRYLDVQRSDASLPRSMKELLAQGPEVWQRLAAASEKAPELDPQKIRLLAPIPDPEKIICIGLNYADHAAETGTPLPTQPVVFNKFPTAVAHPDSDIPLPPESDQVDFEAELVVVIGRGGRRIARQDAWQHIAGYTCGHDVSARDWQMKKSGGQWLLGKSFDSFAPFGPALVTADEVDDPSVLDIRLRLNGEIMQQSNTRQLIFPIDELIEYVSKVCTLKPGDVLFTGTPPGVGVARKPPVFLKPGDEVEVEIENLGKLRNRMIADATR